MHDLAAILFDAFYPFNKIAMDTIFVRDLVLSGLHGANPPEKKHYQRFKVDVRLDVDTRVAARAETLSAAIDYRHVRDVVTSVIEGPHHKLIETLAELIATQLLGDKRIASLEVSIAKLDVWPNGVPGVVVRRKNS